MEEDIKNIRDIQEILTALDNTTKEQLDEAIRNVDKEWSEMELKEDIKVLEWVIINQLYIDTHNECDYHNIHQAIENLIKGYK